MKKWLLLTAAVAVLVTVWLVARRTAPLETPFERVKRERLVSTLVTNGKAEPIEWSRVRAERAGAIRRVGVERGATVARGAVLAELDATAARAELAAAEARIAQARAELESIERGGRAAERADIEGQVARTRLDLQQTETEAAALARLAEKNAAPRQDVTEARDRVAKIQAQLRALELRRAALVTPADRGVAEARLSDAQAAAELARKTIEQSTIRAPLAGVVYSLAVRSGAVVNPGDEIAQVGQLDRLRIVVYVDEPELGRVARGMPVAITWDALPGREWKGEVEKVPTTVVTLGTREVGEVHCVVVNPERALPPGANINASILSRVVENALTIPKEALRREGSQTGVYVLEGARLTWRAVRTGISSVTRIEAVEGLKEGDPVALIR
ncbi:MAG: efflux RND transporter periplasmic adaptor subunit [Acidobacteria bacterium]|nr:efflux RND transporter periplasmic adaptor subunit [Acidobacteriota bacterium]